MRYISPDIKHKSGPCSTSHHSLGAAGSHCGGMRTLSVHITLSVTCRTMIANLISVIVIRWITAPSHVGAVTARFTNLLLLDYHYISFTDHIYPTSGSLTRVPEVRLVRYLCLLFYCHCRQNSNTHNKQHSSEDCLMPFPRFVLVT